MQEWEHYSLLAARLDLDWSLQIVILITLVTVTRRFIPSRIPIAFY